MASIDSDDLLDSSQVADLLGLTHRHSVSTYRRRYADFPPPAVARGKGRTNLWLRSDIETWRSARPTPQLPGRSGADTRRDAILDAATELMATRPITDISVREIAARAGVAHTMIYRHIGSKQDLERAVLDRTVNEVLALTQASPEAALGSFESVIETLLDRRDSLRVLTHSLLTADGAARHSDGAPVMALLLDALGTDIDARRAAGQPQPSPTWPPLSPEVAVGAVAALIMGWVAFEPRIRAGTGLTKTPVADLATLATAILDLARTPPGDASTPEPAVG